MVSCTLVLDNSPKSEDVQVLANGLGAHSVPFTPGPGFQPMAVFLRDVDGAIHGGASGHVNWNWLSIALVWLAEPLRGKGHGRQLLAAIEGEARLRGCQYAHLDTFSWQARPFYEKLGYEVFATLDGYPPGRQRFFMKKKLV